VITLSESVGVDRQRWSPGVYHRRSIAISTSLTSSFSPWTQGSFIRSNSIYSL